MGESVEYTEGELARYTSRESFRKATEHFERLSMHSSNHTNSYKAASRSKFDIQPSMNQPEGNPFISRDEYISRRRSVQASLPIKPLQQAPYTSHTIKSLQQASHTSCQQTIIESSEYKDTTANAAVERKKSFHRTLKLHPKIVLPKTEAHVLKSEPGEKMESVQIVQDVQKEQSCDAFEISKICRESKISISIEKRNQSKNRVNDKSKRRSIFRKQKQFVQNIAEDTPPIVTASSYEHVYEHVPVVNSIPKELERLISNTSALPPKPKKAPAKNRPLHPCPERSCKESLVADIQFSIYNVTREEGMNMLKDKPIGSFVLRTSTAYAYTLVMKSDKSIHNIPISHVPAGYYITPETKFSNLKDMIMYYTDHPLTIGDCHVCLQTYFCNTRAMNYGIQHLEKIAALNCEELAEVLINNGYSNYSWIILNNEIDGHVFINLTEYQVQQYAGHLSEERYNNFLSLVVSSQRFPKTLNLEFDKVLPLKKSVSVIVGKDKQWPKLNRNVSAPELSGSYPNHMRYLCPEKKHTDFSNQEPCIRNKDNGPEDMPVNDRPLSLPPRRPNSSRQYHPQHSHSKRPTSLPPLPPHQIRRPTLPPPKPPPQIKDSTLPLREHTNENNSIIRESDSGSSSADSLTNIETVLNLHTERRNT